MRTLANLYDLTHTFLARHTRPVLYVLVFCAMLITGKLGHYLYFNLDINPAFIWPPAGIALASAYFLGTRSWLLLLSAFALLVYTSGAELPVLVSGVISLGYTFQALLGAYALRRLGFEGTMATTRDAIVLIFVGLSTPLITPTLSLASRFLSGALSEPPFQLWVSLVTGGIFSVMVVTPVVTSLFRCGLRPRAHHERTELVLVATALLAVTYLIFWTSIPEQNIFVALYLFFATLFWIGLRVGARATVYALFTVSVLGIIGMVLQHLETQRLSAQLLATELFMILIAPIFFLMAALVAERKAVVEALNKRTMELEQSLAQLAKDNDSKNDFIAILAHELRNPLAPVLSTLELLKLRTADTETHALVTKAEQQTQTMRRLLDDLLDVVRITRNKFKLQPERTSLQTIIGHAKDAVTSSMNEMHHHFTANVPIQPVWMDVDRIRIEQVVVNLLHNAVKYTPRGGTIQLEAIQHDADVIITITDNGKGIPPEKLQAIFRPFHQTDTAARTGTGLGIGLWLTKRLIGMHGGTITAASNGPNQGSTFTVHLPGVVTTQAPLPAMPSVPDRYSNDTQTIRVLVVDDNVPAASSMEKLLAHLGYETRMVHTGTDAIRAAVDYRPHLLLLDIGLPDIDGYEVARQLIARNMPTTLAALTGYGQSTDKERALQAGFQHHLTKPVSITHIESILVQVRSNLTQGGHS